ncbi:hypothetical protein KPH14_002260 [Odynerus spinipes]|uniref:Farnesyl pyrophosphate synthase n=1 Tax=Odynerus spinipes TaxID=1348599 RepID=A0AAD9RL47_9HYME|nr:hypothetical protein KPH14_002260 [Odynerus spinipes]
MSLSTGVRRTFFAFWGNGFYRKEPKVEIATLAKIIGRESCYNVTQRSFRALMTQATWSITDETRKLMALWPDIVRDLTETDDTLDIPEAIKWLEKVLQYNVPKGRQMRALTLVNTYQMLVPPNQLTEENLRLARILGWCLEMNEAHLLVLDDIYDKSLMRRKEPCWYLHNDIGLTAVNDALMIQNAMYHLLDTHFKEKDYYVKLMDVFQEINRKETLGQCLDLLSTNSGKKLDLDLFTMDRYNAIVKYKTAYFMYILPFSLAMHLAGTRNLEKYKEAILFDMGRLYQIQDDFLDSYGDLEARGKISNDIEEGKCTWLIVVALQRATAKQRQILEECYGSKDPEKVKLVKCLYDDIGLPNIYSTYEKETYNQLTTRIQQISHDILQDLFLDLLNRMYRRVF